MTGADGRCVGWEVIWRWVVLDTGVVLPPFAAPSAEPADWICERYQWGGPWVTGEVGPGFEAYLRVFHPYGEEDEALTWSEVAAEHGKTMHPAAHWVEITTAGPWDPTIRGDRNGNGGVYLEGDLPRPVLAAVCRVLRRHTTTPDTCYFGVWDGWGWTSDSPVRLDPDAPRFSVPARDFLLYYGVIEQALQIGGGDYYHEGQGFDRKQSPTLMWPADHAWCLSTEIDAEYTVIGCSDACAAELLDTPGIEAMAVAPDEPLVSPINQ